MTQQNAALVEQAAAAAESMREQAQLLAQAVAIFKLAGDVAPASPIERSSRRQDRIKHPVKLPAITQIFQGEN